MGRVRSSISFLFIYFQIGKICAEQKLQKKLVFIQSYNNVISVVYIVHCILCLCMFRAEYTGGLTIPENLFIHMIFSLLFFCLREHDRFWYYPTAIDSYNFLSYLSVSFGKNTLFWRHIIEASINYSVTQVFLVFKQEILLTFTFLSGLVYH